VLPAKDAEPVTLAPENRVKKSGDLGNESGERHKEREGLCNESG
jgi:hypothetical protein